MTDGSIGAVNPKTPVQNCTRALRLLRRFIRKTRPFVSASYGGFKKQSILRMFIGSERDQESRFGPYRDLVQKILDADDDNADHSTGNDDTYHESLSVMESSLPAIMEHEEPELQQLANECVSIFCHIVGVWGHASAHIQAAEEGSKADSGSIPNLLATAFHIASDLVTNGCLDDVLIQVNPQENEYHSAICGLAESVFSSDLRKEQNELAAMQFLLSAGSRQSPRSKEFTLRGSHLLQTVRVLYHVYLTTENHGNKMTARASLQQLSIMVFKRMIAASSNEPSEDADGFPSKDHQDAYLVMRSLCKLSMRATPKDLKRNGHVGLQTSGSSAVWDSKHSSQNNSSDDSSGGEEKKEDQPNLVFTQDIHPALESKVLALDLLLNILQNVDMKGSFLAHCGPQFLHAIRDHLCASILKNCTFDDTVVVNLSLQIFLEILYTFRSILKTEIEAFVTNVFFAILDSENSQIGHKRLVVTLFQEICSDPNTLAEIFLNYDCDMSAVDLFHRIVSTLSKLARESGKESETGIFPISIVSRKGSKRFESIRSEQRELRLDAMKALRQILISLHSSIIQPMDVDDDVGDGAVQTDMAGKLLRKPSSSELVKGYDSKKKHREEEAGIIARFNQKPSTGISYAGKCGHVDATDPRDVAQYLLKNRDILSKTQIGEYLGREPEYQGGFSLKVLHEYVNQMQFAGLVFDDAIRYYLSGFRLPGEAQKIDRIMEKFAERFTDQNPGVFPTPDAAFILAFSIIMLNTDLHNPAIKEERRMTKQGFIRNNRGIADGQDLPEELLSSIFDRIKSNPFSLKEDEEARAREADGKTKRSTSALNPSAFFTSHYDRIDRDKEFNFNKERDHILRTTESLLKKKNRGMHGDSSKSSRRRESFTSSNVGLRQQKVRYVRKEDSGLQDEYVSPMFEAAWGPVLAALSTAMESENGTIGALSSIASKNELERVAENAAETIEVCLTGFRFAICVAGLCSNDTARNAFMYALTRFSQLETRNLLEPRNIRCIQTILTLARSDGELLGSSWEYVFKTLSEINRYHQLFHILARGDEHIAQAAERRQEHLSEMRRAKKERQGRRRTKKQVSDISDDSSLGGADVSYDMYSSDDEMDLFSDEEDEESVGPIDDTNTKAVDEANSRIVYEAVSEAAIEAIYERSATLSKAGATDFFLQLCRVSRMEISDYGGFVASSSNNENARTDDRLFELPVQKKKLHQPNIYSLQKLVEATHYNMDSRPRLVFSELWSTVAAHLTSTALHSNPAVAMYALDSFRQLSIHFLQREEPEAFTFQRAFLKPFENIMSRSKSHTTKELLLNCTEQIVSKFGRAGNGNGGLLRSGWAPILRVLGMVANETHSETAAVAFNMLCNQLDRCLEHTRDEKNLAEPSKLPVLLALHFAELNNAFMCFVNGKHEVLSLLSIEHVLELSALLANERFQLPRISQLRSSSAEQKDRSQDEFDLWWPILSGFSRSSKDMRVRVRTRSCEALMKIISGYFRPVAVPSDMDAKANEPLFILNGSIESGIQSSIPNTSDDEMNGSKRNDDVPPGCPGEQAPQLRIGFAPRRKGTK